jgi:asparagine synthase (glutamine-hydrolysing)
LHGLEARAPFLDHELAEYVFRLKGTDRLVGGHKKGWLREVALRHLPRECVIRKKQGFAFPFNRWLHKDFRPLVQERFQEGGIFRDKWLRREFAQGLLDKHLAGKRDYAPQIWHLYTLAVWYDRWIKGAR